MKVAFLGPHGTFTEEAGQRFAADMPCELHPYETIFDSIKAVENQEADKTVVPLENSVEGSVATTLDLLVNSDVCIEKEIDLSITHNLLVLPGVSVHEITDVISHPQAIAQCQQFLRQSWKNVTTHKAESTAEAAAFVAKWSKRHFAAIGHGNAAKLYQLDIAAKGVNDYNDNVTRFVVIGRICPEETGQDKTSIVFSLAKDQPGGLYNVLGEFAQKTINLTKIESRPAKKEMGDYLFFIDLEGHQDNPVIRDVLNSVQNRASFFKILGSYPKTR